MSSHNLNLLTKYLLYRSEVDLLSASSVKLEKSWLSHVLAWAGSHDFGDVSSIRPSFPQHIRSCNYSASHSAHVLRCAKRFFLWLSKRGVSISADWLDTFKIPRINFSEHKKHEFVTYAEILAIASAPVENIRERRIRAACVFWWLSGIRVGAFVTLPVSAVDLNLLSVRQFPRLGVRTKFGKSATTYLFDISELLLVLHSWQYDLYSMRAYYWFPSLRDPASSKVGQYRNIKARCDLRRWLSRVGLPYHSPHKFRHGHAVYAIQHAQDIKALKAISQNLMHENLSITDGVYGVLSDLDVARTIRTLIK